MIAQVVKQQIQEHWNGTSWTEVNNMGSIRQSPGAAGQSGSSGLAYESTITDNKLIMIYKQAKGGSNYGI